MTNNNNTHIIDRLRDELHKKVGICPSRHWLEDCIHASSLASSGSTVGTITSEQVLQQILHHDLRDVVRTFGDDEQQDEQTTNTTTTTAMPSSSVLLRQTILASKNNEKKMAVLPENFLLMVQIEELLDFSANAEKRFASNTDNNNNNNENHHVGSNNNNRRYQNQPPQRCFKFCYADGYTNSGSARYVEEESEKYQSLVAMEIKPIPSLDSSKSIIPPAGIKVVLSGSIIFRHGIAGWHPGNTQVLGGFVPDLVRIQQQAWKLARERIGHGIDPTIKALIGTNTNPASVEDENNDDEHNAGEEENNVTGRMTPPPPPPATTTTSMTQQSRRSNTASSPHLPNNNNINRPQQQQRPAAAAIVTQPPPPQTSSYSSWSSSSGSTSATIRTTNSVMSPPPPRIMMQSQQQQQQQHASSMATITSTTTLSQQQQQQSRGVTNNPYSTTTTAVATVAQTTTSTTPVGQQGVCSSGVASSSSSTFSNYNNPYASVAAATTPTAAAAVPNSSSTVLLAQRANPYQQQQHPSLGSSSAMTAASVSAAAAPSTTTSVSSSITTTTAATATALVWSYQQLHDLLKRAITDEVVYRHAYGKVYAVQLKQMGIKLHFNIEKSPKKREGGHRKYEYVMIARYCCEEESVGPVTCKVASAILEPHFSLQPAEMRKVHKSDKTQAERLVRDGGKQVHQQMLQLGCYEVTLLASPEEFFQQQDRPTRLDGDKAILLLQTRRN